MLTNLLRRYDREFFHPINLLKQYQYFINITNMLKDYFQRNAALVNDLRTQQFKVNEYIQKGKYRLKQKFFSKGKKHYDFDINSQQYFHEEVSDIAFQSSQIQDQYSQYILNMLQAPASFRNYNNLSIEGLPPRKNPAETRNELHKFFKNRAQDLEYQKYKVLLRLHNIKAEQQIQYVTSRINLIDKQIQMCLNRADRLSCEDGYEESYSNGGNKPVPINENGQPIYKYLEEEECWFSNINREDIIIFSRNQLHKREVLMKNYDPIISEINHISKTYGLNILIEVEAIINKNKQNCHKKAVNNAEKLINYANKKLQQISPGNLTQKQNINTFIYTTFGVLEGQSSPLTLPIYPALYFELFEIYNKQAFQQFFMPSLKINSHKDLISLLPKLNNFCSILFKYQNKEIIEEKPQIKLGLDDDVDIKKELFTMLQESWVQKFIKVDFERYDYKMKLIPQDWQQENISQEHLQRQEKHHKNSSHKTHIDSSLKELQKLLSITNYNIFRKHMKKRSELILARAPLKYKHIEQVFKYCARPQTEETIQHLGELFKIKFNEDYEADSCLKPTSNLFLEKILEKDIIENPVEIEIEEQIKCLKMRQCRTKMLNICNGMRCYHRNLANDLRVICQQQFDFRLDDELLINSNKQTIQNFEKAVKDGQTYMSRFSKEEDIKLSEEQFVTYKTYDKSKMFKKDKVEKIHFSSQVPHVLVSSGRKLRQKIIYSTALKDLQQLQARILENGSRFIDNFQRYIKTRSLPEIVDRVDLLSDLYDLELKYQYQKFKLIEQYYYIYQNTTEPLNAFKLSNLIMQIIYQTPELDFDEPNFKESYNFNIEKIKTESKSISLLIALIQQSESNQCKLFHDKYAKMLNIPLTLQAYLYGDMQKKAKAGGNKLQRMNSMSSRMSKASSKKVADNTISPERLIVEQFREEDSQMSEQDSFDLEKYDEYLLKRNMDSIFEDMIGEEGNMKDNVPASSIALQNLVVNPRFEGGPHLKPTIYHSVDITTQKQQGLVNFNQFLYIIGNIHNSFRKNQQVFESQYGYVSKIYQLSALKVIAEKICKVIVEPKSHPTPFLNFETDDPYHQTVTKSMKYYEETMASCLQPPSNIQMAIPTTLQKHQEKTPIYGALQCLDFYSIHSLIMLKKPVNSFRYKQLGFAINFMQILKLQTKMWEIQLLRERSIEQYHNLAKHCEITLEKSISCYANTGQSEVFASTQQIKMYNNEIPKYAVFPEMVEQIRLFVQNERTQISLFGSVISLTKHQLEDLIIMTIELQKKFLNGRIDRSRILAPNDPKCIKMIKNRLVGLLTSKSSEILKGQNYLKYKQPLKVKFQEKLKTINEKQYLNYIDSKDKITPFCQSILTSKIRRLKQLQLFKSYTQDLGSSFNNISTVLELHQVRSKVENYVNCLPFLNKLLIVPNENKILEQKVLYDQTKIKNMKYCQKSIIEDSTITNPFYIYTHQQLIDEYLSDSHFSSYHHLHAFDCDSLLENVSPPSAVKEQIYAWAFNIPQIPKTGLNQTMKHFLKTVHPFTGKITPLQYHPSKVILSQPQRNKYLTLLEHYSSILTHIEAQTLLISLQVDDQIFNSIRKIIRKKICFEKVYKMPNDNSDISIQQGFQNLENNDLSVIFNFLVNVVGVKKEIAERIQNKSQRWAAHDEIIDFISSKVQGFGVLRESFLPMFQNLKNILENNNFKKNSLKQVLRPQTQSIYKNIRVSLLEQYLNEIYNNTSSEFPIYFNQLTTWFSKSTVYQRYHLQSKANNRVNIGESLFYRDHSNEKERFMTAIYNKEKLGNVQKARHSITCCQIDIDNFVSALIFPQQSNTSYERFNPDFLWEGLNIFRKIGQQNRHTLFARIRHQHEKAEQYLSTRPLSTSQNQKEILRSGYFDILINKKMLMLSTLVYSAQIQLPSPLKEFKEAHMQIKEQISIDTYKLCDKFEQYRDQNKIQFSKLEVNLIGKAEISRDAQQHNNFIKELVSMKLIREEFKFRLLSQSLRMLKSERLPKNEAKRIINTSLIPRVHLISSYSSPLMIDRKTYISQQYKLAFLQAFVNRFRNKVSRVDLLSSGYGFVITVPDLQDCVNYMNKLLFTFTQKQFKSRLQTFSQYFDIMLESINEKNKTINEQKCLVNHLREKYNNLLEAEYLGRVSTLLHEKTLVEDKLKAVQNNIHGIEDRIRRVVEVQYEKQIQSLTKENYQLKNKFREFKESFVVLAKDSAKNNYLDIVNNLKEKVDTILNKKVDFKSVFQEQSSYLHTQEGRAIFQSNQAKYKQEVDKLDNYTTQDLQRCKIGESILYDPYYTTKLINKMRLFNLFKLGARKLKQQDQTNLKSTQMTELHKIQDKVVTNNERQMLLRGQLTKVQEELSKKCVQLEKLKHANDNLENQKTKIKILLIAKEKKLEQKQIEIDQVKKTKEDKEPSIITSKIIEKISSQKGEQLPKLTNLRKQKKFYKKTAQKAFITNLQHQSNSLSLYQRFQLSSKDASWRQKCEQLYIENKKLISEMDRLQSGVVTSIIPSTPKRQSRSLNLRNKRNFDSIQPKDNRFPNLGFKFNILKQ